VANRNRAALVGGLFATLVLAAPTGAQTDTTHRAKTRVLDSVRVTGYVDHYSARAPFSALRIDAPLSTVPLAVSVVTRDVLNDQAVSSLNDAFHYVAGVTPQAGTLTRPNFYAIRGFYAFTYRDGTRMMIDGEPPLNAATIQSIEVLKGPSSILYGRGEPGGLVNFETKRPIPIQRQWYQVQYGSNDARQVDVDVTGPLGGVSAYRVIGGVRDNGSYRKSVTDGQYYINPSLSFTLNDHSSLLLTGEVDRYSTITDLGYNMTASGSIPALYTRSYFLGAADQPKSKINDERIDARFQTDINDNWQMRLSASHENPRQIDYNRIDAFIDAGPTGYLGLLPANNLYRRREGEEAPRNYTNALFENEFNFHYLMGDLQVKHQLLVSADWRREHEDRTVTATDYDLFDYSTGQSITLLPTPYGFSVPFGQKMLWDERTQSLTTTTDGGVSAQDLVGLGGQTHLLLGLRYESNRIESSRTGGYTQNAILGGQFTSEAASPPTSTTSHASPRVGLLVDVTPTVHVYGSYLTSFEAPIPGLLTAGGATLKPELGKQLEGGVKTDLLDGRAEFTASVFDIKKTDAIVINGPYGENVGEEHVPGYEADLTGSVTPELRLIGSFAHQDQKFTKGDTSLVGRSRPGLPKTQASVWGMYDLTKQIRGVSIGAGAHYQDKMYASSTNKTTLPGGTTLDAMIGYAGKGWDVQLNVMNITNTLTYAPTGPFNAGTDPNVYPVTVLPSAPSRVMLTFRVGG
jgi:iron complex outermembrane receptor protein